MPTHPPQFLGQSDYPYFDVSMNDKLKAGYSKKNHCRVLDKSEHSILTILASRDHSYACVGLYLFATSLCIGREGKKVWKGNLGG